MARRELGEINAGSMADIAFLLLIFFLVTTTMDRDTGILRMLPAPPEENQPLPPVKDKNVFIVLANNKDQLLVEGDLLDISQLKNKAIEFLTNPSDLPDLPTMKLTNPEAITENYNKAKANFAANPKNPAAKSAVRKWEKKKIAADLIGRYRELPSSAIISLRNDRGTSYELYIQVQNELSSAVAQLRDELSKQKFGVLYTELDDKDPEDKNKIIAIQQVYPVRISEAEPANISGS